MKVSVRLFAGLRERAGAQHVEIELPDGAVVEDLLAAMGQTPVGALHPGECVVAINREYAGVREAVRAGDEVRSPARERRRARRRRALRPRDEEPLDVAAVLGRGARPARGRGRGLRGRHARRGELDYEAYAEMALEKLARDRRAGGRAPRALRGRARAPRRHGPAVGASVLVAASAPHRGEAFAAPAR